ncbi:DUF2630 family protein [Marinitenerispora sediminis]|uniref:DUF2630 domain-containing protein n=1 Tax=Marinitenerispora sediminis TaxID=1931232 RepID=A0A368T8I0_9ACTN|nr:DUF2630 family protein [Marinitenerispora sediminis]RCV52627.1 DUF2630 domain-containing protein [Marinitenerispora sediminis]RCV60336.1 DUF2630 domain-containing protein [Marinitenerispora sediminis]RCV60589.1 DUF2630 domain-containing protein [Marinitenerispora sediminis]
MDRPRSHEAEIIRRIGELVTEERDLREQHEHRLTPEERERMRELETALNQCWDLLRRRRASERYGRDSGAPVRAADTRGRR